MSPVQRTYVWDALFITDAWEALQRLTVNARAMNGYAVQSSAVRNRGDGRCGGGESDGGKPADVTVTTE